MALSVNSVMEINGSATTTGNLAGGGFNPTNANMMTDLATTTGTSATPSVTSGTYTFVAGDVGHWVYVKSGTNWIAGWYKIASVAANAATLSAAVGEAVITDTTTGLPSPRYKGNTAQGCCTQDTPGGNGTFTIDYSQGLAHILTATDYTAVLSSTTMTSVTGGFTKAMIGNFFHQTTTGTGGFGVVGWYEIVNVTDGNTVTLDRTPNVTAASVACTGYTGGALSFNSTLDDDAFEISLATNGTGAFRWFVKGSVSLGEAISVGAVGGSLAPIIIEGYQTLRGDAPTGSNRPTINNGANTHIPGQRWRLYNLILTGTASYIIANNSANELHNCKIISTTTSASLRAVYSTNPLIYLENCEMICYRGSAFENVSTGAMFGCYLHDSNIGLLCSSTASIMSNCIVADNVTYGIRLTAASRQVFLNNTIYGSENKLGIGFSMSTGFNGAKLWNNILYGFTTGVSHADTQTEFDEDYNAYFNNTTDVTNVQKNIHSIALTPAFTDTTQITGTGATSSTNVLTGASGTPFSTCEANVDFVYLSAGTGPGIGLYKYLITAVNAGGANVTLSSNITTSGSGSAIAWQVTTGHDFTVGTNMKAVAFPGQFPGL